MNELVQLHAERIVNKQIFAAGIIPKELFEKTDEAIMRDIDSCEKPAQCSVMVAK